MLQGLSPVYGIVSGNGLPLKNSGIDVLIFCTEYSNIDIDERGFIYATIPSGDRVEDEAVRKLNPSW